MFDDAGVGPSGGVAVAGAGHERGPSSAEQTDLVAVTQQLLRSHGHKTVPVDGVVGSATTVALRHYQEAHGLAVTGTIDGETIDRLRGHHPTHHEHPPIVHQPHHVPATPHAPAHHESSPAHHPAHGHQAGTPTRVPAQHHLVPGHHPSSPSSPSSPAQPEVPPVPTQPRFPLNRVLALLGPYVAIVSGAMAAWLSRNFPGLDGDQPAVLSGITQGVTFVVGAVLTWAMHHKYLDGWQRWERDVLAIQAAERAATRASTPAAPTPLSGAPSSDPGPVSVDAFGAYFTDGGAGQPGDG